jgi:hypothetical protein
MGILKINIEDYRNTTRKHYEYYRNFMEYCRTFMGIPKEDYRNTIGMLHVYYKNTLGML